MRWYLIIALFTLEVVAQTTYISGTFQWAIWASGPTATAAVQAQCPADHPQRCDSISRPDYCCPWGDFCMNINGAIGCCPNGQSCNGVGAPPPTWQPSTVYSTATATATNVVVPVTTLYTTTPYIVPGTTTAYVTPGTTTTNGYNGYCSTLTVNGGGLPTTRAGQCGTILVVSEASVVLKNTVVGFVVLVSFSLGVILVLG